MCPTVQQFKNTVAAKLSAPYCIDHYYLYYISGISEDIPHILNRSILSTCSNSLKLLSVFNYRYSSYQAIRHGHAG